MSGLPGISLRPAPFSALAGWARDDHWAALVAFARSFRPPARPFATWPSLEDAGAAAQALIASEPAGRGDAARAFFESRFLVNRVAHQGAGGLLTAYYEPVVQGSRQRRPGYQVPVYARPADLVTIVDEARRAEASAAGTLTHMRKTDRGLEAFATREQIDRGALDGQGLEILYLASPVDRFFLQVQGSGRVELVEGGTAVLAYDGKNGHPYTSIGRHLIEAGAIVAEEMSLEGLRTWLEADIERGRAVMAINASFVFFRELSGALAQSAPFGVHEIPLTAGRSLAVDASVHGIGTPVFVTAPTLRHLGPGGAEDADGFCRLMVAQDVGSAIRGPERGDIYAGSGETAAGLAGITRHPCVFHVLLPRQGGAGGGVA